MVRLGDVKHFFSQDINTHEFISLCVLYYFYLNHSPKDIRVYIPNSLKDIKKCIYLNLTINLK